MKNIYDRRIPQPLRILVKLITFNAAIILGYLLLIYVFLIPIEGMDRWGKWTIYILLGIGNVVFLLYDWLLNRLNALYDRKLHRRLRGVFRS